jgi:hypothetical protein
MEREWSQYRFDREATQRDIKAMSANICQQMQMQNDPRLNTPSNRIWNTTETTAKASDDDNGGNE